MMLTALVSRRRPAAFADRAAPSAGFLIAFLDEFFEMLQIILNTPGNQAQRIAGILDKSFRIIGKLQRHLRPLGRYLAKTNRPGRILPRFRLPRYAVIRNLFQDSRTHNNHWSQLPLRLGPHG